MAITYGRKIEMVRRWRSEIRHGQGKLIGFLVRRVRGLVMGRCPRCKAAMGWNRRCPYDTVD